METRTTLLLNSTYEVLSFITDLKAIRLICKNKVEILANWQDIIFGYATGFMYLPAVLKMKYYVHKALSKIAYSRENVLKRDQYQCQYCSKFMKSSIAEIDHVVPRKLGGQSSFENCVAACHTCNSRKGSKPLVESGLKLLRQPFVPHEYLHFVSREDGWHETWDNYVKI